MYVVILNSIYIIVLILYMFIIFYHTHICYIGAGWVFSPGPAHLDTCEFILRSVLDKDLILKYVGFIDRGQRIESRYVI